MKKLFAADYRVMYHDVDLCGNLSLTALGNYILDVAGLHAVELGASMNELSMRGMTWVMSGLRMEIYKMPKINDILHIETVVTSFSRISTQRDFFISSDDSKIAEVSTEWLILNTSTRRPVFLTDIFDNFGDFVSEGLALEKYQHIRNSILKTVPDESCYVKYSDIDMNNHLYSMKYLEISINALGIDFCNNRTVKTINANFVQEVRYGDRLEIYIYDDDNDNNSKKIEMIVGDKVAFRAMLIIKS